MSCVIMWFRRDLRISDNPALDHALSLKLPVIPIYIEHNANESEWPKGSASRWWCHHSLKKLRDTLDKAGLGLHFFQGNPLEIIPPLVKQTGASVICFNSLYEPQEVKQENDLNNQLSHIDIKIFHSHLLFKPGNILNNQQRPYRVFTPFWKKARLELEFNQPDITRTRKPKTNQNWNEALLQEVGLEDLGLLDQHSWHEKLHQTWTPGEASAQKQLDVFLENDLRGYEINRDYPAITGTSKLSAHLHFGEITPARIINQLQDIQLRKNSAKHVERFVTELGWREFAHHVLWHFPHTIDKPMNAKFAKFWPKKANSSYLKAWQTGNTGVPIVDAGMRELWETGWMHNRVRMIVASFLTKNLGIHWLHGAKWFWDTLVDADLANNTLGWQWVAGCGVDAAPFYRIFNPDTQAKKFDKNLEYINRWVPEINELRPPAIVDQKLSRENALKKYRKISS
jgi:deoxyribodipyrimidine photo-lyase